MKDGPIEIEGTIEEFRPLAVMTHRITTIPEAEMTSADLEFKRKVEEVLGETVPSSAEPIKK